MINNYNTNMEKYETTDLGLASLLSMSFPLEMKVENKKGVFVFNKTPELQQLIKGYWDNNISVEPQSYFDAIKKIKNRLYNSGIGGAK